MRLQYHPLDLRIFIEEAELHLVQAVLDLINESFPSHSHGEDCYELHYVASGKGTLLADGQELSLEAGTFYVTGPHVEHAQFSFPDTPLTEYCVFLKLSAKRFPHSAKRLTDPELCLRQFTIVTFWLKQNASDFERLITALFREAQTKRLGYRLQIEAILKELFVLLVRSYHSSRPSASLPANVETSEKTALLIDEYFLYFYASASLENLSQSLGLSPRQTERLIRQYYGKTFQQKKAEARMAAALILLRQKNSVTRIAETLGYSSIEHFSSAFRNYYGVSPSRYRKQAEDKS